MLTSSIHRKHSRRNQPCKKQQSKYVGADQSATTQASRESARPSTSLSIYNSLYYQNEHIN